ncbi:CHAT domain-containing protein [Nordella sp. HKS 07]|uniref:CHAT domain-containing protein n=1 Tax=Nordella sp. HKS 07 TaxID=2712222 RepID=UPI0013E1AC2D|nr:CHAT domain-containing protein [Nordella sp. HKS 07]QIG50276.1 CHAT domain-containing protein [Nordella sp. HKS 07]
MSLSCTRLIAVITIAFMLVQPCDAQETPAVLIQPQGSVLIRNDPEVRALLDKALDAAEQGDSAEIKTLIGKAEAIINRTIGPSGRHMTALHQEAAADFVISGEPQEALAHGLKAVALGRKLAASYIFYRGMSLGMPVFEQTEPFRDFLSTAYVMMDGADADLSRRLTAEAFKVAQLAQMTKAGLAVLRHQATQAALAGRRSDEVKLVQMVADTIGPTLQTGREIAAGLHGEAGSPGRTEMEALNAGQQENLQEAIALIAKEKIDIADILLPRPLEVDAVARLLEPDEALVFFVEGNMAELHGFVVTRESVRWREIALKLPDIEALVARFRAGIGAPLGRSATVITEEPAPDEDDTLAPAWQLYQALLGPFEAQLQGKTHLLVAVDGALAKLPFESLLTAPPPAASTDARVLPWLVHDHAVTVLPVLSAIAGRDRQAAVRDGASEAVLGIGNPHYAALAGKPGLIGAVQSLEKLTPLPESDGEVRRIAEMLGSSGQDLLTGRDASEEKLYALSGTGMLAQYRMLIFATHGLLPGEIDGLYEGALALTPSEKEARQLIAPSAMGLITSADGLLTTSEIPQLKLKADIVVLSACNTGADSNIDLEAYSGLAAAFLQAGARSVMVSHWPVNSDAAVAITTGTIRHWQSRKPGRDFVFAFRQALLEVIETSPETGKPSYWAPFSLFGEP